MRFMVIRVVPRFVLFVMAFAFGDNRVEEVFKQ